MQSVAISALNLSKYYTHKAAKQKRQKFKKTLDEKISADFVCALEDINFEINRGEIFGIIGPDGAGKTSLFRILTTLFLPSSGTAIIEGFDILKQPFEVRKISGYMPGKFSLYQDLTVEENLQFFATLFHTTIQENYHLIKDIYQHIEPFKNRRSGDLSGGMKQKLALSCSLIHKPNVLFLDEPTTGVDPVSRQEFWGMLKRLKEQNITILVSTPYMDEAKLCDRIGLIDKGRFLKIDSPPKIISDFKETLWAIESNNMFSLLHDLRKFPNLKSCFAFGDVMHVTVNDHFDFLQLESILKAKGHENIIIKKIEPGIEDCFMALERQ